MTEQNVFGLREYSRKDLFEGTTDEIRAADRFYIMHEADNVIIELKEKHKTEVKELLCLIRDKENNFNCAFDSEEREIRHHKYRRCLGQVEICQICSVYFFRISETTKDEGAAKEFRRMSDWCDKWEERWLKLAEKFKETK